MSLEGVVKGERKAPRLVVYGPPKIGKSTLGSETEKPIFVTTEDGVDNLPVEQFPAAPDWATLGSNLKQVAQGDHDYKTLVLDTLNGAAELASQYVCVKQFKNDWGPKGFASFGQGWAATSEEMRRILPHLDACRSRGMVVLLLAHTGIHNVRNPLEGDYTKYAPDVDRRVWARFSKWTDIILRADFEYTILDKKSEGKGKAVGSSTRILHAVGSAAEDAGCRVGWTLPAELPLSWQAITEALVDKTANTETLTSIKARWGLLTKPEQAKTMKWLGVKKLTDAEPHKLGELLNRLKSKEVKDGA